MTEPGQECGRHLRAEFARIRDGQGIRIVSPQEGGQDDAAVAVPLRVARLLALAHRIERRIATGDVVNRAAAARDLEVTRARLTQILNLTLLAPDIQEEILFAGAEPGHQPINEHALRWVLLARDWPTQRARFRDLLDV